MSLHVLDREQVLLRDAHFVGRGRTQRKEVPSQLAAATGLPALRRDGSAQLAPVWAQPLVFQLEAGLSTSREEKVPALALANAADTPFQLMTSKKAAV